MHFSRSPWAQYAPLASTGPNHASLDNDEVYLASHESLEKTSSDRHVPVHKSWQYKTSLGIFLAGLLLGAGLSALGFMYSKHRYLKDSPYGIVGVKQFAPRMRTRAVVFSAKPALMDPPNETNQQFWDALMPVGHGFVNFSNPESYGLLPGIPTESGVDRYSVAMYHQLHCLGILRSQYWRLIDGMLADSTSEARQEEARKQLRDHHSQHCFAYIAESIMCAGDLSIEWAKVEKDGSRIQVDGWGVTHQCKDPDAIWKWMEANHGPPKEDSVHLHE